MLITKLSSESTGKSTEFCSRVLRGSWRPKMTNENLRQKTCATKKTPFSLWTKKYDFESVFDRNWPPRESCNDKRIIFHPKKSKKTQYWSIWKKMVIFTQKWNCVILTIFNGRPKLTETFQSKSEAWFGHRGGLFTQVGSGFDHISKGWPRGNFWKTKNVKPDLEIFHPKSKNTFSTCLKCDQNPQKRAKANLRPDMVRGESG